MQKEVSLSGTKNACSAKKALNPGCGDFGLNRRHVMLSIAYFNLNLYMFMLLALILRLVDICCLGRPQLLTS